MPPEKVRVQTRIMAAQVLRRDDDDENGQRRDAALKGKLYLVELLPEPCIERHQLTHVRCNITHLFNPQISDLV